MPADSDDFARAVALHRQGDSGAAESLCRGILAQSPDDAPALHLMGTIRFAAGAQEQGVELVRRALAAQPGYAAAEFNLAAMLAAMGRLAAAADHYRRAAELEPGQAEAQSRLAAVLMELGRWDEAESAFRRVLEHRPDDAAALTDLAALALRRGNNAEALRYARGAVSAAPGLATAHVRLGYALMALGHLDEAAAAFEAALAIEPGADAWRGLAFIWSEEGLASEAARAMGHAAQSRPDDARLHSLWIMAQELDPKSTRAQRIEVRRSWAERFADPLTRTAPAATNARDPARRLRIGYVGADTFRTHTGATVLLPIVEAHDRRAFEIYCYSDTPPEFEDEITARFRGASIYRATAGVGDDALATLMRRDGIDVAVETYGHPPGSRLLALAHRPAPVQIGFQTMASSWMAAIDYVIGDSVLTPKKVSEFRERVVRVPFAYVYNPAVAAPQPDPDGPFERTGTVVFGCFNRWSKLNDGVLRAWAEILRRVPDARLVLRSRPELAPHTPRFERRLTQLGVPHERVSILGWSDSAENYLAAHSEMDISLDPFPYGGGTTTCDALLMGVPVVALASDRVLGRYSEDFLRIVGVPELVAHSAEQYVALAVKLARDHVWRARLRGELPRRFRASRLFSGGRMARDLERVYRAAWHNWCTAG
jgi:protein O-GlcNAc transferase